MVPTIRSMKQSVAAASQAWARVARLGQMLSLCAVLVAAVDSPALAQTPPAQPPVLTEAFDPINMPDPGQYEEDTIFGMKVWESSTDPRPAVYFARGYTLLRYDGQNVESLSTYPGHIRSMEVFDADGPGPGGETIHFFVPGMGTLCSIPPVLGKLYSYDPVTGEETWVNFPYTCKQVVFCSPGGCTCGVQEVVFQRLRALRDSSGAQLLFCFGVFSVDGQTDEYLAIWNGSTWSVPGSSTPDYLIDAVEWDPDGAGPAPRDIFVLNSGPQKLYRWNNGTPEPYAPLFGPNYGYATSTLAVVDPDGTSGPKPETLVVAGDVGDPLFMLHNGAWKWVAPPVSSLYPSTPTSPPLAPIDNIIFEPTDGRILTAIRRRTRFKDNTTLSDRVATFFAGTCQLPLGKATKERPDNYYSMYSGTNIAWFDRDGEGPAERMAMISGMMISAGDHRVRNLTQLSRFNSFVPFGESLDNHVHALAFHDEDGAGGGGPALYAGGKFIYAGGRLAVGVARWDGSAWQEVGGGTNNHVDALASYKGRLIAGGKFTHAGGKPAGGIAAWDGTQWTGLGPTGAPVRTLSVIGEHLYAGGLFKQLGVGPTKVMANRIARYDGTKWAALGGGINGAVNAIASYQGEIIAGGGFTMAGNVKAGGLAAWNGTSWRALGFCGAPVKALAVYNNELIAGGNFSQINGVKARRLARFNGASWSPFANVSPTLETINALTVADFDGHGPRLFIGGRGAITSTSPHWLAVYDASVPGPPGTLAGFNNTGKIFADSIRAIAFGQAGDGPASLLVGGHFNALDDSAITPQDDQPRAFLAQFIAGADAARLLDGDASAMASHDTPLCVADCDANGTLDASDLACFHAKVQAHDPHADCNRDGLTNLDDLICFQTLLAQGC